MTYLRPDENTLGSTPKSRRRSRKNLSFSTGGDPGDPTRSHSLGFGSISIGFAFVTGMQSLFTFGFTLTQLDRYPNVSLILASWLLYMIVVSIVIAGIFILRNHMPGWLFVFQVIGLGAVVALDYAAIWNLGNLALNATSSISASFALILALTFRPRLEISLAGIALAVAFMLSVLLTTPLNADTIPTQILVLGIMMTPPLMGSWLMNQFRRTVQLQLDRVLVQSTVSAPRFGVGMLASERLARLDRDAEKLFETVADRATKLPLDSRISAVAAALATELRLHLIEGRRETWLHHAIVESEHLGRAVTLSDTAGIAGLLDQNQRDSLLSALWILATDTRHETPAVKVTLHPAHGPGSTLVDTGQLPGSSGEGHSSRPSSDLISVPITIISSTRPRGRIDPSVWRFLAALGETNHHWRGKTLEITVLCLVAVPAEQYHSHDIPARGV